MNAANRIRFAIVFELCVFFSIAWSAEQLPTQLSDAAFWKLITDFSEPVGSFGARATMTEHFESHTAPKAIGG